MSKKIHTRGNFLTFSPLDAFTLAQAIVQDKPFEDVVKQYGFDPKLVRAMAAVLQPQIQKWPIDKKPWGQFRPWGRDPAFLETNEQINHEFVKMRNVLWKHSFVHAPYKMPLGFHIEGLRLSEAELLMPLIRHSHPPHLWIAKVVRTDASGLVGTEGIAKRLSHHAKQHSSLINVEVISSATPYEEPVVLLMPTGGGSYPDQGEVLLTLPILASIVFRAQCLVYSGVDLDRLDALRS